ncbi:MAG: type II toxin-antitoxin system RelE family toxin [Alphaproteobacteria bacterium]
MHSVRYSKEATRTLSRMPRKLALSIQAKIATVAADPYAKHNNVARLKGRDGYRLRVGDWRVIYEIAEAQLVIHVVRIASRGSIYQE